jgi:ankyrin repeat protein
MAMRKLKQLTIVVALVAPLAAAAAPSDQRLVAAAAAQQTEVVRALLKKGVDVNTRREDGATALLWAAHWDDLTEAELLLNAGADANAADDHGVTPLGQACENASAAMVARLLAAKADPDAAQVNGLTPLMIAARTGSVAVVTALLDAGAQVNATTTGTHESALMWAVAQRHRDVVGALLARGADVQAAPGQAFSPLLRAARNGDIDTAKVLLAAGARINDGGSDGTHPLVYAIISGQAAFAHFLLEQGADPNGAIDGTRALHAAAGGVDAWLRGWNRRHGGGGPYYAAKPSLRLEERLPLVKALLAKGADPNARTTASEMMSGGFLRNGAYDNFTSGTGDVSGATPLWVAAYSMNGGGGFGGTIPSNVVRSTGEILRVLLSVGADAESRTHDGTTPLMAAAGCGWSTYTPGKPRADRRPTAEEAVKILVEEAHAGVNVSNEADFTPLHCAAFSGLNELVQYLVERGAALNARDWRGRTPFRIAEGAKQSFQFQEWPEAAGLLRSLGADTSLGIPGTAQERLRSITDQQ